MNLPHLTTIKLNHFGLDQEISKMICISFLYISIMFSFCAFTPQVDCMNTLTAVTRLSYSDIVKLHKKVSETEISHQNPDDTTDSEAKRQICLSITKSAYFDMFAKEDPVQDMTAIYHHLRAHAIQVEEEYGQKDKYYESVLRDYEIGEGGRHDFTYRSRLTPMVDGHSEFAFPCLTRVRHTGNHNLYFITNPHNINKALDAPTSEAIQARFVCITTLTECEPWILAEEPAIPFAPPHYSTEVLEKIYLELRRTRDAVSSLLVDPLCTLTISEKVRACSSVMNSPYFADKVRFVPHPLSFSEKCEFNEVSFLTEEVKRKTDDRHKVYREWMFGCTVSPVEGPPEKTFTYFLSRAYQSHHALVYRYNKQSGWNIENISGRISVIIDSGESSSRKEGESSFSLIELLEKYKPSADRYNKQSGPNIENISGRTSEIIDSDEISLKIKEESSRNLIEFLEKYKPSAEPIDNMSTDN